MTRLPFIWTAVLTFGISLAVPPSARAQEDDAEALKLAEPDFTLIALPTSLRVPKYKGAFRVTHRFTRPLNDDFGDVAADFFGMAMGWLANTLARRLASNTDSG